MNNWIGVLASVTNLVESLHYSQPPYFAIGSLHNHSKCAFCLIPNSAVHAIDYSHPKHWYLGSLNLAYPVQYAAVQSWLLGHSVSSAHPQRLPSMRAHLTVELPNFLHLVKADHLDTQPQYALEFPHNASASRS